MIVLRTVALYCYVIVVTPLLGTICSISALLGDRRGVVWWRVSRLWACGMVRVGGVTRIHVEGQERLDALHGAVLMSNHESHFDPPTLIAVSKRVPLRFLTKHTLFYFPVFGIALHLMGHVFINRGKSARARRSLDRAAAGIAAGKVVFVFPEGTRSRTGDLLPFKKGGFAIARQSGVPIIPVGIAGTRAVLPAGWMPRSRGPVVVVVGDPVPTSGCGDDERDRLVERVRGDIEALRRRAAEIRRALLTETP